MTCAQCLQELAAGILDEHDGRGIETDACLVCGDTGEAWDPAWCGDPDHCSPLTACPHGCPLTEEVPDA